MGNPPCIMGMLRGVIEAQADKACIVIARFKIDEGYLAEEVSSYLEEWSKGLEKPLDINQIDKAVEVARQFPKFTCALVVRSKHLRGFCVGKASCPWASRGKEKAESRSFYEFSGVVYEEIWDGEKASFVSWDGFNIGYVDVIETGGTTIHAIAGEELTEGAVTLPSGALEYGDILKLFNDVRSHIYKYVDLPQEMLEFTSWYVLFTWVYDKLPSVLYLRFMGDISTGKSRALDIIGRICYKACMLCGAVTPAPIYRMVKRYRGTMILDEADFRESSEKHEVITILNSGFEPNRPILRCSKEDPDKMQILPCFGPKILATRYRFEDAALESRCLTQVMEETDRGDIPIVLAPRVLREQAELRNKLLMFRLKYRNHVNPDNIDKIDLGNIERRLAQTGVSLILPFVDIPELFERFKSFLFNYNKELIEDRAESFAGKMINAICRLAQVEGKEVITPSLIANTLMEDFKLKDITPDKVGRTLRSMGLKTKPTKIAGKTMRPLIWDDKQMSKLIKKYVSDPELQMMMVKLKPEEEEAVGDIEF